ncbi:MAG: recombinase family protein [Clostridia bacterium]|nr:recombinase family protein [Clostridia bacterium]
MAKKITVIPPTLNPATRLSAIVPTRRRVAAYARVSTDSEEQQTSYKAQVDYYTNYIARNPDWEFVEVYTDEGISAVNTKKRNGFNRMIKDALDGKIDLIVTKSVSRFARNTVDSLVAVRNLKNKGVEIYFEKENIYTLDSKGELLITIMSSLAQEESRSISENVTWGQRKRLADGKVTMPYSSFLGYKKGEDGIPEIVPEEAEIVRLIYKMFIEGKTVNAIAKHLTKANIPTPRGKYTWQTSTIESILTNEKYKGAAILQKKFTVDFLQKKMKVNEGEVPQYHVTESHPSIIPPEEWEIVQAEMKVRKSKGKHHNSLSPFSAKLVCADCGEFYGSKVWHSNSKYKRTIWQCNKKFKGDKKCTSLHLYEEDIKRLFIEAFSTLLSDRTALLEDCRLLYDTLINLTDLEKQAKAYLDEMEVTSNLVRKLIDDNASSDLTAAEYSEQYENYTNRFDKAKTEYEKLQKAKNARFVKAEAISAFMFSIQELPTLPFEFDEKLWNATVEKVTVYDDGNLTFHFKNGVEITKSL